MNINEAGPQPVTPVSTAQPEKLPSYLQMYEISGQDTITIHSFRRYLKDKERDEEDIRNAPENPVSEYKRKIKNALEEERAALVREGLATNDLKTQKACMEMIIDVPENERAALIRQALTINNPEVQSTCARKIWLTAKEDLPELKQEVYELIKRNFFTGDIKTQKIYAEVIWCAPPDKELELIEIGLNINNPEIQKVCAEMIRSVAKDRDSKVKFLKNKVFELIKKGLNTNNPEAQKVYAEMIEYAPESQKRKLLKLAKEKLGDALLAHPLYRNKTISDEKFLRDDFEKTGSETTLIGGKLKDKTIIRHIEPETFLVWQKVYEDYEMWEKAGFDYVPIEPIQSFRLNKDNLVDVYSGVLDISLYNYKKLYAKFTAKLEKDRDRIRKVLKDNKIEHGHDHNDNNFCLRFFRDKDGKIDFSKKPRLYLIDFDQATSSQK